MPVFWDGLLNYISRCIDSEIEIDKKDVCVVACDFYKKGSILISRKCLAKAGGQINANKDGTKEELISELYDCYVVFREKDIRDETVFCMYDPSEVPEASFKARADLSRRLLKIERKLEEALNIKFEMPTNSPVKGAAGANKEIANVSEKRLFSVVVANPPEVSNLVEKRQLIEKCGISNTDVCIKSSKSRWLIKVSDRVSAENIAKNLKSDTVTTKVTEPVFIGVVKGIPSCVAEKDLKTASPECTRAIRIGSSSTFKMYFPTESALSSAIRHGIRIEYDCFRIEKFLFIPKRCYNCQHYGHVASECKNAVKCARCSGGHTSSREQPCSAPMKCANCGSKRHPSYSIKCKKLNEVSKFPG